MRIYEHKSYEEYVEAQTKINKSKITWVYANPEKIKKICEENPDCKFVICHGTRNGAEQKYFKKHLPNAEIIGTEISDNAETFEMTVQHDFSIPKEEWIGKADIVYSNALDHSNVPEKTIQTWKNQLSKSGRIYLEYSEHDSICEPADCLDATESEIIELLQKNGLDIINKFSGSQTSQVLVCENKERN